MSKRRNIGEYDGYFIPPCDLTIPPDERARLKEEAKRELRESIKRIKEEYKSQ